MHLQSYGVYAFWHGVQVKTLMCESKHYKTSFEEEAVIKSELIEELNILKATYHKQQEQMDLYERAMSEKQAAVDQTEASACEARSEMEVSALMAGLCA